MAHVWRSSSRSTRSSATPTRGGAAGAVESALVVQPAASAAIAAAANPRASGGLQERMASSTRSSIEWLDPMTQRSRTHYGVIAGPPVRHAGMTNEGKDNSVIQTTLLSVGGMSCGACVHHITRALEGMSGVVHVEVDLQKEQATVEHLPDWMDEGSLIAAIKDAGYQAKVNRGGIQDDQVGGAAPADAQPGAAVVREARRCLRTNAGLSQYHSFVERI
jgi:copper chaperone